MGNNKAKKRSKLYILLENNYEINLFYRPSMQNDDTSFYIDLDKSVRIVMKIIDDQIIIIQHIIPLTSSYLLNFYREMITMFRDQKDYTVILSKLGMVDSCIDKICNELDIPLVDNDRFLSTPVSLYERIKSTYSGELNFFGSYIIAVSEIPYEEKTNKPVLDKPKRIDSFKKEISSIKHISLSDIFINYMKENYSKDDISIEDSQHAKKVTIGNRVLNVLDENSLLFVNLNIDDSSVLDYLSTYEIIEKFNKTDIIIENIQNSQEYNVCRAKGYEKLNRPFHSVRFNSLGSFIIRHE